jgi:hypothetical protein
MSDFVDLAKLAEAVGFASRSFTPIEPAAGAERLSDLPPDAIVAIVFGPDGATLPITAGMVQNRIAATIPEHVRDFASWLAVAHLRCLITDPEYPT